MKLQEAIEKAEGIQYYWDDPNARDIRHAISLLITAGKRCLRLRSDKHCDPTKLLLGETKE